jgi:phosphoribosylformimino-5-aminoimidazole carboxamide ribotide isomerase
VIIIPAIDLKNGQCVRLVQGDFERITIYSKNPAEIAKRWQQQGAERIHVVDLDGSLAGVPRNKEAIRDIVNSVEVPIQVGGGIRDMQTIEAYLDIGIGWVILGTKALTDRKFLEDACRAFSGKIILGLDAKDGKAAVQGWTEQTSMSALETAKSYEGYGLAAVVYTDIKRDGMEGGVNLEATKALAEAVKIPVIASGGVSSMSDIEQVIEAESSGIMGVIVGKALYTGAVSLRDAVDRSKRIQTAHSGS